MLIIGITAVQMLSECDDRKIQTGMLGEEIAVNVVYAKDLPPLREACREFMVREIIMRWLKFQSDGRNQYSAAE
jgi:hypothetical protein